MSDGLDHDGAFPEPVEDLTHVYRFSVQDKHGHTAKLPPYAIPPWLMGAIDEWHGRDKPFKDRAEFLRDALYHQVLRCKMTWPGGGVATEFALHEAELGKLQAEFEQREALVQRVRTVWENCRNENDRRRALAMTREVYDLFAEKGYDTIGLQIAAKYQLHDD